MNNLIIVVGAGALGAIGALYLILRLARIRQTRSGIVEARPTSVRFIGEQDGPRERTLKAALAELLQADSFVKRAYLARLDIGAGFAVGVCIKAKPLPDVSWLDKINKLFLKVMGPGGYLHILFLTDDQELEISRVCRPFYESMR